MKSLEMMAIARSKSFNGFANSSNFETRVQIHSDVEDSCLENESSRLLPDDVTTMLGGKQRRRRSPNNENQPQSEHSFSGDVTHAASETYLLTRLTFKLLRYLGLGYRWICKFLALSLYAMFLMPGFIQVAWYYYFSKRVHRSVVYGDQPRNRLDLYLPEKSDKMRPAVAFVTGGAWIIGYKAWGALLGRQLVENDIIVACIDYRNFPQGGISDMMADVSKALAFFYNNIEAFGGNKDRLYLAGQSAGAHIASCVLLEQAKKEIDGNSCLGWSSSSFKAFFGISGGYNLLELVDHFHKRGLYKSLFLSIMEGEASLGRYSPELVARSGDFRTAIPLLPPMVLFHGTGDYSIPHNSSVGFADALRRASAKVTTKLYDGKTHTDIIIQDPMRGGRDELLADILEVIHNDEEEVGAAACAPLNRRLVPECLLQLARRVSPF